MRRYIFLITLSAMAAIGCGGSKPANNSTNYNFDPDHPERGAKNTAPVPSDATPVPPTISAAGRPQKIVDMMAARGEQDSAAPVLKIVEPQPGATLKSSTVKVKLNLTGDLKGYQTG